MAEKLEKIKILWEKLKTHGATNRELRELIKNVPELRNAVWQELKKMTRQTMKLIL